LIGKDNQSIQNNIINNNLEAVLAYEIASIKNYTTHLLTTVTINIGWSTIIFDVLSKKNYNSDNSYNLVSISRLLGILSFSLSILAAKIVELILPKNIFFDTDKFTAKSILKNSSLIMALEELNSNEEELNIINNSIIPLYFVNPIKSENKKDISIRFSIHPEINERIKKSKEINKESA
jgi:Zn-dependent protease with chaperone function